MKLKGLVTFAKAACVFHDRESPGMRYYFDMIEGDEIATDEAGMELPDIAAAQEEAAIALAAWAKAMRWDETVRDLVKISIEVRDNAGLLMTVRFDFEDRTVQ